MRLQRQLHFLAALFGALLPVAAWGADYFVSPRGDDRHSGRGPADSQALRTIQAGVNRLRAGDTLYVRGGTYRETVTFPRSGAPGKPIRLRPYRGETVVITGCDPVTGWTRDAGAVWKAPMPWTLGTGRNQVFARGQVLIEARFPNRPAPGLEMPVAGLSPLWPTFGEFSIPKETALTQPGRIVSKLLEGQPDDYWKGALYYGIHYEGWCGQTGVIESSRSGEIQVGDRTRVWWFPSAYGVNGEEEGRGMIVGHRHALEVPGEWVWEAGTLYLIPAGKGEPRGIEAKRRQLAFDLSGRQHIRIEGIAVRAASARLEDSAWCTFDRCDFRYISHFTRQYDIGQVEPGRDTIKSGETGIYVSGHDNAFLNCSVRFSAGAGFHLRGYHHTIHNCLIDEVSYTSHYLNAITDAVSDFADYENFLVGGHVITFNTMRNAGRHFFNFYGNGTSTASRTRSGMDYLATLFAHNHLYNGMLQTRDAGFLTGYYCSAGTLNGLNSLVAYNVLHDCYDISAMKWNILGPIYLDAGTCDVDVRNNLLWAAPGAVQRSIWFNTCCVDCSDRDNAFHPHFTRTCADLTPGDFPNRRPFRFGHDFASPPPLPHWPPIITRRLTLHPGLSRSPGVTLAHGVVDGLTHGAWLSLGTVDLSQGWQTAVMRFASDAAEMNTDRTGRSSPRHRHPTDPLVMEATARDGASPGVAEQWTFIHGVRDGAWVRFNQVPLGAGYERVRLIYGKTSPTPAWVEVRLGSPDGPLAARVPLKQTDRPRGSAVQIYAEAVTPVSPAAQGTRDVCLVFRSQNPKEAVCEFEYARFERARQPVALFPNEVKLEVRVGSPQGLKIGEFYPRATGGLNRFREMVAPLEPARGRQALYLTVRSALARPIGRIEWIRLERAQPGAVIGIGLPPRRDARGRYVFPEPTHRPRSRPADRYAPDAAGLDPRPVCVAARLSTPPAVDGSLGEWARLPSIPVAESWDRSPASGPASQVWVGYDEAALYIAARNPVTNAPALRRQGNVWGQDDGIEIVLQDGLGSKRGPVLNLYGFPDGHCRSVGIAGAPPAVVRRLQQGVTYRAVVGADEWRCEWRIPFAAAGFVPKGAPAVLFNAGVFRAAQRTWAIWRGTGGPTYHAARGGILAFAGAANALLPREGLAVWLDAAEPGAIQRDSSGRAVTWKDRSGHARDASQPDAAHRPFYDERGLNGRPALRFDEAAETRLELPDLAPGKITATVFAVVSNPTPGSLQNHDARIFTASDGKEFDYIGGIALTVPGMETGGPRILSSVFAGRSAQMVRVGCFSPLYQTYFTGHIAEILVYSRRLSPNERDRVRAYLTAKWGLTTP